MSSNGSIPVIAAMSIYNEANTIEQALESCKSLGISSIHILDGPWAGAGYRASSSTDGTKDVVARYVAKNPALGIEFCQEDIVYRTQGEKRNRQLKLIGEMVRQGKEYVVLVIDGDEYVRFHSGLDSFPLGRFLYQRNEHRQVGFLECFARGSDKSHWTPRLFPSGQGIHYHTEQSMTIHRAGCKLLTSYDPEDYHTSPGDWFRVQPFFLVNDWTVKVLDNTRVQAKAKYSSEQRAIRASTSPPGCRYSEPASNPK